MPCVYESPEESRRNADREWHRLTRALCNLVKAVKAKGLEPKSLVGTTPGIPRDEVLEFCAWLLRHEADDAKRLAREAADEEKARLKASARTKLSPEERKALGLP